MSEVITKEHTPRGSKLTCSGCGLPICEVIRDDAYVGSNAWGRFFGNWRVPEPATGTLVDHIRCPVCGGRWIKDKMPGLSFHFDGYGWWPSGSRVKKPKHPMVVKRGWLHSLIRKLGIKLDKATFSVTLRSGADALTFGDYMPVTEHVPFDVGGIGIKFNTVVAVTINIAVGVREEEKAILGVSKIQAEVPSSVARDQRLSARMRSPYPNLEIPVYITLYRKKK